MSGEYTLIRGTDPTKLALWWDTSAKKLVRMESPCPYAHGDFTAGATVNAAITGSASLARMTTASTGYYASAAGEIFLIADATKRKCHLALSSSYWEEGVAFGCDARAYILPPPRRLEGGAFLNKDDYTEILTGGFDVPYYRWVLQVGFFIVDIASFNVPSGTTVDLAISFEED